MTIRMDRRVWKPVDRPRIVLATMISDAKLADICRREGVHPTLVY